MNKLQKSVFLLLGTVIFACTDPNIIGLEVQPPSDKIIIKNDSIESFSITTVLEDSLRSDEASKLLLGQIDDPIFGENKGEFVTQMLLPSNSIDTIENVVVDSVVLTYAYSSFYGDLDENNDFTVEIFEIDESIFKDSVYYSDFIPSYSGSNLSIANQFSDSDTTQSVLNILLDNDFGQKLIDATGTQHMVDNESFLEFFKGFYVTATASNTIMYLDPNSSKSKLSVYYHEIGVDTMLSLDFDLASEAARINIFNTKEMSNLSQIEGETYIQSMAAFKAEFTFNDIPALKDTLRGKAINKVSIDFEIIKDENYPSHDKLYLVRETNDGRIVFLTDFTLEGDEHFGGTLGTLEENKYSFNISRYFYQLLNDTEYTNKLYILSSGAAVNANRTILNKSKISINIIYTEI